MIDQLVFCLVFLHVLTTVWLLFRFPGMLLQAAIKQQVERQEQQHNDQALDEGRLKHPSHAA